MPKLLSQAEFSELLLKKLEEDDAYGFADAIDLGLAEVKDWEYRYAKERGGCRTILQLALEMDRRQSYAEQLLKGGASADYFNEYTGSAPIHSASTVADSKKLNLLFSDPDNMAEINTVDRNGLSAFHILLRKLIAAEEMQKINLEVSVENLEDTVTTGGDGDNVVVDLSSRSETELSHILDCLILVAGQNDLQIEWNRALSPIASVLNIKPDKVSQMTPLQVICSFQKCSSKPISKRLHLKLRDLVATILKRAEVDPNATGMHHNEGRMEASTPPIFLAAARGYYKVIKAFIKHHNTDLRVENRQKQNILHVILYSGYYSKIVLYGEGGLACVLKSLHCLYERNSGVMASMVNHKDAHGNTALYYSKHKELKEATMLLLNHGARIDQNPIGVINIDPDTLLEYFNEHCIKGEGDDFDDDDYKIKINYKIFEQNDGLRATHDSKSLIGKASKHWGISLNIKEEKIVSEEIVQNTKKSGKVDTKCLEYLAKNDEFHSLFHHPVLHSFLEIEKRTIRWDLFYEFFFICNFLFFFFFALYDDYECRRIKFIIYENDELEFVLSWFSLWVYVSWVAMVARELWQAIQLGFKYWIHYENPIELAVVILAGFSLAPGKWVSDMADGNEHVQRHIAALTLLLAFMRVYTLIGRSFPYFRISADVNMYAIVLSTYSHMLLSYIPYLGAFAYCFYLILHPASNTKILGDGVCALNSKGINNTEAGEDTEGDNRLFASYMLSFVKTIISFTGEVHYEGLHFTHWLGQFILIIYVFLVVIVLFNVLNGLAVDDIKNAKERADVYHYTSMVDNLAHVKSVKLVAEEVVLYPNRQPMKGGKRSCLARLFNPEVYPAKGGPVNEPEEARKDVFFSESTVRSLKEFAMSQQQQQKQKGKKESNDNMGGMQDRLSRMEMELRTISNMIQQMQTQ